MPKRHLRNLKIRAIAAVDDPCQEHAKAFCVKRRDDGELQRLGDVDFVAKYVCENDGAHTFSEVLRQNIFSEKIWPCVDAFTQSIRSIVGDQSLTGASRAEKIGSSTGEFLAAVRAISPDLSKRLEPLVAKKDGDMTVEELNAKVAELTGQLTSANALVASEKARADGLQTQLDAEKTAHSTTKAALVTATDESIVVGGQTISKSAVGDAQFTVMKALHEESATTRFEKRAELEFAHVTGTPAEKAAVLKHLDTLPADNAARKAAEAILTSAEKMAKAGFANLGSSNDRTPSAKQAQVDFEGKVEEIMARDKLTKVKAMSKARREFPELFAEMQGN